MSLWPKKMQRILSVKTRNVVHTLLRTVLEWNQLFISEKVLPVTLYANDVQFCARGNYTIFHVLLRVRVIVELLL